MGTDEKCFCQSRWLTPAEAAAYARVKEETIRRWINEGLLRAAITKTKKVPGSCGPAGYVIDVHDVDKLMESLKVRLGPAVAADPPGRRNRDLYRASGARFAAVEAKIRGKGGSAPA